MFRKLMLRKLQKQAIYIVNSLEFVETLPGYWKNSPNKVTVSVGEKSSLVTIKNTKVMIPSRFIKLSPREKASDVEDLYNKLLSYPNWPRAAAPMPPVPPAPRET